MSEFVQESKLPLSNWANGCPPESALRQAETKVFSEHLTLSAQERHEQLGLAYVSALSKSRSFIYDHARAMDVCLHPENMRLHGFTTAIGTNPGPLMPLFTFAKTAVHSDVLATPLEQYSPTYIGYDPDWDRKTNNKLLWRGSTTGADFLESTEWRQSQRARLHFMTHERKGSRKVWVAPKDGPVQEHRLDLKDVNGHWFDTSFSGSPVQCDPKTCAVMSREIDFQPTMGLDEAYSYKYVIDVDGNGWSGRFHRLMSMKAMTLKVSTNYLNQKPRSVTYISIRNRARSSPSGTPIASNPGSTTSPSRSTTRTCTTSWLSLSAGPGKRPRRAMTSSRRG